MQMKSCIEKFVFYVIIYIIDLIEMPLYNQKAVTKEMKNNINL